MKRNHNILLAIILISLIATCICLCPEDILARAGGGGGGEGGGILGLILWPFILIYSAIISYLVYKKNNQSKQLLQKLASLDNNWDLDNIKRQVEKVYFKVQESWMQRNQDIAKDFMSERLYEKHKLQTDQMISQNRKNILKQLNLKEAKIVEIADYEDDSKDRIWVHIKGSMIDYIVDDRTNKVISGDKFEVEKFSELWKFVRGANGWVLDEIDQKVQISDLVGFKSFSEELKNIETAQQSPAAGS